MRTEPGEMQKAVDSRDFAHVLLLLSEGVDVNAADATGWTPLARAAVLGDLRLIDLLLAGGAVLEGCCHFPAADPARLLTPSQRHLRSQPELHRLRVPGWTALLEACRMGSRLTLRHLLEAGADPNRAGASGGTPLMESARLGHAGISRELLKFGAVIDLSDQRGRTALHFAAERGFAEVLTTLLGAEADPSIRDSKGADALMLAAGANRGVIEILLQNGADPTVCGVRGDSALLRAVKAGNLGAVELLIEHGADVLLGRSGGAQIRAAAERCRVDVIRRIVGCT